MIEGIDYYRRKRNYKGKLKLWIGLILFAAFVAYQYADFITKKIKSSPSPVFIVINKDKPPQPSSPPKKIVIQNFDNIEQLDSLSQQYNAQ